MLSEPIAKLLCESISSGVMTLSWPEQADEREHLDRAGVPRLWFVESGVEAPVSESCLEDWLRLPAEDSDVRARLVALARRAVCHPSLPTLDERGRASHRGAVVYLSPVEQHLMGLLIANFDNAVLEADLLHAAWPDSGRYETLRVHVSRLRRRLAPIGLEITNVHAYGYMLQNTSSDHHDARSQPHH